MKIHLYVCEVGGKGRFWTKSGIIAHKNNIFGINGYHGDTSGITPKNNIFGINGYHGDTSGIIVKNFIFGMNEKITPPYFFNTGPGQFYNRGLAQNGLNAYINVYNGER